MCIQATLNLIPVIYCNPESFTPAAHLGHPWSTAGYIPKDTAKHDVTFIKPQIQNSKKGRKKIHNPSMFCPCLWCKPAVVQANLSLIDVCAEQAHQAAILWREGEQPEAPWGSLMQHGCMNFQGDIRLPLNKHNSVYKWFPSCNVSLLLYTEFELTFVKLWPLCFWFWQEQPLGFVVNLSLQSVQKVHKST